MTDIDLQIEQIESARQELKKHFGEHYELSALTHTIPLLEELKELRTTKTGYTEENRKTIFKEIRAILDKYDKLLFTENLNEDECKWLETDYIFDMAKALNKELPDFPKIAKMFCIMNGYAINILENLNKQNK